jgi:hypothetical protein
MKNCYGTLILFMTYLMLLFTPTSAFAESSITAPAFKQEIVNLEQLRKGIHDRIQSMDENLPLYEDANTSWAAGYIALFQRLGFVDGYDDGTFRPEQGITRAEFTALVVRVFDILLITDQEPMLDTADHWAREYIGTLNKHRVINGYEDGSFRPDQNITNAELIAVLSRIVNLPDMPGYGPMPNLEETWNKQDLATALMLGMIGRGDAERFVPQADATRADCIAAIIRGLALDSEIAEILQGVDKR